LTAGELNQLELTCGEWDNMTYTEFVHLIEERLNRKIPVDNDLLMERVNEQTAMIKILLSASEDERKKNDQYRAEMDRQNLLRVKEKKMDRFLDFVYCIGGFIGGYIIGWINPLAKSSPTEVWHVITEFFWASSSIAIVKL